MRFDLKKLHHIAMAALVPLCAAASKTWADQNPGDYLHNRTYIGLIGTSINVSNKGEFTGPATPLPLGPRRLVPSRGPRRSFRARSRTRPCTTR
jgi:hypothetical protein